METQERTFSIEIHLNRSLVIILLTIMVAITILGYFALRYQQAEASEPQAVNAYSGLKKYYLTQNRYYGYQAGNAGICASGYHFASLWEIRDMTGLEYNASLGFTRELNDDRGYGPPSGVSGWIRTGFISNNDGLTGQSNCNAWSSSSGNGTAVYISDDWNNTGNTFAWISGSYSCNNDAPRVWCVEN
jgi:hypothetical protein